MKLLVLAPQWPDPPRQGAAIRNFYLLQYLMVRHDVTLLTFTPEGGEVDSSRLQALRHSDLFEPPTRTRLDRLKSMLSSRQPDMAWRLRSPEMCERVRDLSASERFDAVHIEGIEMASYGLLALETGVRTMTYDAHNAEYLLQQRAFATDLRVVRRLPRALYSLVQWWRLRRFERQVCLASEHVIAVSEADRAALARLAPERAERMVVLPNGVDIDYWSPTARPASEHGPIPDNALVFDGTMDFRPNVDAVLWFAAEVWPLIRAERPESRFYIVGRSPAPEVAALGSTPGITVTGAVDDPRPWVAGATVYVVPMRMGGGVRLKLLQAMAMERAVVSTPMGAEGVAAEHGTHLLVAHTPQAFARATLSLLSDPQRRASLGRSARRLVAGLYSWPTLLPRLDTLYEDDE